MLLHDINQAVVDSASEAKLSPSNAKLLSASRIRDQLTKSLDSCDVILTMFNSALYSQRITTISPFPSYFLLANKDKDTLGLVYFVYLC